MLKVENISFSYTSKKVLSTISFTANRGDYIAVVGESGCGKSTLLEIIYGLLHIDKGAVYWDGEKLRGPKFNLIPGEKFMKYLPQDFDLMPYITVEENVGKNLSYLDKNRSKRIVELLEVVDMTDFLKTKVINLSGGQKQRVAIAKVLAKEPEVLLLDEPFSHIDNFRKNKLRRSLFKYLKAKNILCLVATHDTTDALSFANEIIVLKDAKIEAQGTPEKIYNTPKNAYVASFFNEINKVSSKLSGVKNKQLFYPNEIKIVANSELKATVTSSYFKGSYYLIEVEVKGEILFIEHQFKLNNNQIVFIEFNK